MRRPFGLTALVALSLALGGCSRDHQFTLPTSPDPISTTPTTGSISVSVADKQTNCQLAGALVEIVSGPGSGRTAVQHAGDCPLLQGEEWFYSTSFQDLARNEPVRLRVSADGYTAQELETRAPAHLLVYMVRIP
jgi:hypothetical protein